MTLRPRLLWARLSETLWFIPSGIGLAGVLLAVVMVELSAFVDQEALARFPRVFGASADSSRSLLSAIGGSVITVAGVTFSLTMVAVTQASSQYTSRTMRTFMRDRSTQVVLGAFVGIFAYCLLVLRTIRSVEESRFVPALAVVLGIVLALVAVGALIFFIHHIATTLQVSHLVERIARDTVTAVDRLFPDDVGEEASPEQRTEAARQLADVTWIAIAAKRTGYVQSVDADRLVRIAASCDSVIRLEVRIGEFIIEGTPIASIASTRPHEWQGDGARPRADEPSATHIDSSIVACFTVGTFRTLDDDAAFGVRQIVDVALRALSPGVNDTTTAVTCLDWLGAILVRLADRRIETPFRSVDGIIRVVAVGPTFESMLALAMDQLRQNAGNNVEALGALLELARRVGLAVRDRERRSLLETHVALLAEQAERGVAVAHDRDRLRRSVELILVAGRPTGARGAPRGRPGGAGQPLGGGTTTNAMEDHRRL